MERVVVVDVETSGLSTLNGGRVIEIGAVQVDGGAVAAEFGTLSGVAAPIDLSDGKRAPVPLGRARIETWTSAGCIPRWSGAPVARG